MPRHAKAYKFKCSLSENQDKKFVSISVRPLLYIMKVKSQENQ